MAKQGHIDIEEKLSILSNVDVARKVPSLSDFEEPDDDKYAGGNNLGSLQNQNTDPNTNTTGATGTEPAKTVDVGGVKFNIPKKDATTTTTTTPPVTNPAPVNILVPPAHATGGVGPDDIVDMPDGGGKKANVQSTTINPDPAYPGSGLGNKEIPKIEVPSSILTSTQEDIASFGVDIFENLILAWFKDRPSIDISDLEALMIMEKVKKDHHDNIIRYVKGWNKAIDEKISLNREERDALINALLAMIKGNTKIAETFTPEVRAGILVIITMFNKFKKSQESMPNAKDLIQQIRAEVRNAPKEQPKTSTAPIVV